MKTGRPLGSRDRYGRAIPVDRRLRRGARWRLFVVAFGRRLRQLLEGRDVACSELAAAIQVDPMTTYAWTSGRRFPAPPTLLAIAQSLSCSVVDLLPEEAHHIT